MCSKQNRRFKSKSVQHDYRNTWIENIKQSTYANVMFENSIQIKSGMTTNVGASSKISNNVVCVKKITFGILLHELRKC